MSSFQSKDDNITSSGRYTAMRENINLNRNVTEASCCHDVEPTSGDCCYGISKSITFEPCKMIESQCLDVSPSCDGRLLLLKVYLKNVCPNKHVAMAVLLYKNNRLYALKTRKIDTSDFRPCSCRDFYAGKFCFVLPEDNLCNIQEIKVKVIAHYIRC